ncbi:MAG: type III-A CRISPR-associated RAMP protein Csm3 [Magnetococcales bacterium]|nr:type III-A CRISPR-associated RAMP protein Csm3 [Magnetococcales bacterium]MBF0149789.1 type III-A CRISPR-associated RAMP protein Csm3 [Magnetococcales bacterium]MBF0348693.1 type III-A CRISPR-associated RAMP protein Csm3 [Magnetococcales bacterium]
MQLTRIDEISGKIELVTGLHIGSGNTEMHIGGSDNPVIRHPHTAHPYIPGSSIKGKVRSLLEWWAGLAGVNDGKPMSHAKLKDAPDLKKATSILKLFGVSGGDTLNLEESLKLGPSRVSFRDCSLDKEWLKRIRDKNQPLTEVKMENTIDRVRGTAKDPRNVERVPAGAKFDFQVALKVLNDEKDLLDILLTGLKLLEMDSLGGSGSRGYGKVKFTFDDGKIQEQFNNSQPW